MTPKQQMLDLVRGKKLKAVEFVEDYYNFQFEEFIFAALAKPTLFERGENSSPAEKAAYDGALTRLVGAAVISTTETSTSLEIQLDNGVTLIVSLDASHPAGPEMAMLSSKGMFLGAWNLSEPSWH